jgi:carboxypeptidase C (cathepsin A)
MRWMFLGLSALVVLGLSASTPAQVPAEKAETKAKDKEKDASADEKTVVTKHEIKLGDKTLKYTTTVGLMPIRNDKDETEARIFYIAYTLDREGEDQSRRSLMFSFNGGPGSASVWLHLGALGPKRVAVPSEPEFPAPPYRLVENVSTWLDQTDLVFIDPVGTGYSRAAKPELNKKFHGLRGDIESVGEFIRMYLTRNERWESPLYLVGESYGTTRAAAVTRTGSDLDGDGVRLCFWFFGEANLLRI